MSHVDMPSEAVFFPSGPLPTLCSDNSMWVSLRCLLLGNNSPVIPYYMHVLMALWPKSHPGYGHINSCSPFKRGKFQRTIAGMFKLLFVNELRMIYMQ